MEYGQVSPIQTIGGTGGASEDSTGDYFIENPWGGRPSELKIIQAVSDGAGKAWLTLDSEGLTPLQVTNEWRGMPFWFTQADLKPVDMDFAPSDGKIVFTVQGTSHILITFMWRLALPGLDSRFRAPAAEAASLALAEAAQRENQEHTRWGAETWANVAAGTNRTAELWRMYPGTGQSRAAEKMAGEPSFHDMRSRRSHLRRLVRLGSTN